MHICILLSKGLFLIDVTLIHARMYVMKQLMRVLAAIGITVAAAQP
jgi:hypothetical protein